MPEGRRPDTETLDLVKLWGLDTDPVGKDEGGSPVLPPF